jgi:hypothetical protein
MIVTFLTGKRPELLSETIKSIKDNCPELLDNDVLVFNNSGDKETQKIIQTYGFDSMVNHGTLPIGSAISALAYKALEYNQTYWIHVEDDWYCHSSGWYKEAIKHIQNPDVSQVRLRLDSEPVLKKHMITGEEIVWQESETYKYAEKAHMTFNPSIIRCEDIPKIFPCTGERDAQKNWLQNGMQGVVQLIPGVFEHIGEDNSLRAITRCEP